MTFVIRKLEEDDWKDWKRVRLEAIQTHPEAFGSSYEDEAHQEDEVFKRRLVTSDIFGCFVEDNLVGIAGFFVSSPTKMKHRGTLFSMYLQKNFRGQGMAAALVQAVVDHARNAVSQIHCTVVTQNTAALKLYQKFGFQIYGTEPRSLKIGDDYYDEHLMVRIFND